MKSWQVLERRQFFVESTPLNWIAPKLAALPRYAGIMPPREPQTLKQLLAAVSRKSPSSGTLASIGYSATKPDDQPGVVLDYLIVNQALLNVNFADYNKAGFAALGQESWDLWNVYDFPDYTSAALTDLQWSDYSGGSGVGIVVSNAPVVGNYSLIEDPMYGHFVYGSNSARLTVTITNLPANVYDLLVYAPRTPVNGSPVVELKRAGTTLWTKNLTQWGSGWHSPAWEEGEQYVRFRNIAVTNQTLRLEVIPDAAGLRHSERPADRAERAPFPRTCPPSTSSSMWMWPLPNPTRLVSPRWDWGAATSGIITPSPGQPRRVWPT